MKEVSFSLSFLVVLSAFFLANTNLVLATHPQVIDIHHSHTASSQDYGGSTENILVHSFGIIGTVLILTLNGVFTYKHLLASSSSSSSSKKTLPNKSKVAV